MVGKRMGFQKTIREGNPDCKHNYVVYYADGSNGIQSWTCDSSKCDRREEIGYYAFKRMLFPPGAYIKINNTGFDDPLIYTHKANEGGIASILPENKIKSLDQIFS